MESEIVNVRLQELETVISSGMRTFIEVGKALQEIRDFRLYLNSHETFEDYCRGRWEMARRTAYQLISSCDVIENVRHGAQILPTSERQARPLTRLSPEQQIEAWQTVIETAPEGKITARFVSKVVNDVLEVNIVEHCGRAKQKITQIQKESIVDEELKQAFEEFYKRVQDAKLEKWVNTSKLACLQMVKWINDLIEV